MVTIVFAGLDGGRYVARERVEVPEPNHGPPRWPWALLALPFLFKMPSIRDEMHMTEPGSLGHRSTDPGAA